MRRTRSGSRAIQFILDSCHKGKNVRKILHVTITILIMLVVSRFVIRLVDATVQIDDDIGLLILLLVILNAGIAGLSLYVFRRSFSD